MVCTPVIGPKIYSVRTGFAAGPNEEEDECFSANGHKVRLPEYGYTYGNHKFIGNAPSWSYFRAHWTRCLRACRQLSDLVAIRHSTATLMGPHMRIVLVRAWTSLPLTWGCLQLFRFARGYVGLTSYFGNFPG